MGEFVFRIGDDLVTYTNWSDIPSDLTFDNVIKFLPVVPEPPHTEEQHNEIELWPQRLKEMLNKELK